MGRKSSHNNSYIASMHSSSKISIQQWYKQKLEVDLQVSQGICMNEEHLALFYLLKLSSGKHLRQCYGLQSLSDAYGYSSIHDREDN
ncbi:hypothetical protein Nepgr_030008 [Nepenthes gracilis]|uniref:Uncharacterized protein n=1 Tax=Nepenthes gracilis TaxID=150966 RepID=A0AAD3TEK9_NEPGR|nr:hypothetical protein Nepgr_030008 [Nepenthes gracilis]